MAPKGKADKDTTLSFSELQKSEQILRAAFNSSQELISVSTIFGEFVEVNRAFCEACGKTREELVGTSGGATTLWVDLSKREEFKVGGAPLVLTIAQDVSNVCK